MFLLLLVIVHKSQNVIAILRYFCYYYNYYYCYCYIFQNLLYIDSMLNLSDMKFRVFWDILPCSQIDVDLHGSIPQKTLNFILATART
jgi:hypothetical protein